MQIGLNQDVRRHHTTAKQHGKEHVEGDLALIREVRTGDRVSAHRTDDNEDQGTQEGYNNRDHIRVQDLRRAGKDKFICLQRRIGRQKLVPQIGDIRIRHQGNCNNGPQRDNKYNGQQYEENMYNNLADSFRSSCYNCHLDFPPFK